MFSLTKIVAFALLALAPYASATPEPAPNAIEVAARAAPTTDIVKLMTDTKADLQAACAQISEYLHGRTTSSTLTLCLKPVARRLLPPLSSHPSPRRSM